MRFKDAAQYFNQTPVYDGYTGALLFYGRTSTHDDHSSSGATSKRRTLTTAPEETPPARGVVTVHGERWLVGTSNLDTMRGEDVRRSFDLKKSTGALEILTPGQAASGAAGTSFYARQDWYRDQTDTATSSEYQTMWNVFCPSNEDIVVGAFFRDADGKLQRVRNYYLAQERLHIAETDQLEALPFSATFTVTGKRDLATDTYPTVSTAVSMIELDLPMLYQYRTKSEADYQPGDHAFLVAKSQVTPVKDSRFTVGSVKWKVEQAMEDVDAWLLRARRA